MSTMTTREKAYILLEEIHKTSSFDNETFVRIKKSLTEASYTMSEAYLWPDANSVSPEQILLCYRLVQYLISNDGILDPKFIL